MFAITCLTCFLELPILKTRIVDDGPVAYCLTVSYTSDMTLHGTESDKFNVPAVGIRLESTRGIKHSPTTDTFSGKGNATGASEFQNLLMILYPHDEAKRNSCRLWRDWSPGSFCEHLNLVFPDIKSSTSSETQMHMQCQWSHDGNTHAKVIECLQSPVSLVFSNYP